MRPRRGTPATGGEAVVLRKRRTGTASVVKADAIKVKVGPALEGWPNHGWLFLASFASCVAAPITYFISFEVGDLIDAF